MATAPLIVETLDSSAGGEPLPEWGDRPVSDLLFWVLGVPSGIAAGGLAIAFAGGLLRSLLA